VGAGLYRIKSGDLNMLYRVSRRFVGKGYFHNIVEVWFLVCILEDKVVLIFGDFERTNFVIKFGDIERTGFGPHIWRIG
jgi:hypothetical protein